MPSDDPIILDPPALAPNDPPAKPKPRVPLVPEWRKWWRMHSVWLWGLVAFLPETLEWMTANGWFDPASQPVAFKALAAAGVIARLYQRAKPAA